MSHVPVHFLDCREILVKPIVLLNKVTRRRIRRIHQSVVNVLVEEANAVSQTSLFTQGHILNVLRIDLVIHLHFLNSKILTSLLNAA